jgi:hypothetical protein
MKAYGGVDVQSHISGLRYLLEVSGQLHSLAAYPQGRSPSTHWMGGWVGPRAGLGDMEKILDPTGTQTLIPRLPSP